MHRRCIALIVLSAALAAPASALAQWSHTGERYSGSLKGVRAERDPETSVVSVEVDDMTVDVDPCHSGLVNANAQDEATVGGCGAVAYVMDALFSQDKCPAIDEVEAWEYLRESWSADPSPEGGVLSSGPVSVPVPLELLGVSSPGEAYRVCLYAFEDVQPTLLTPTRSHWLVAQKVVDGPPSNACAEAQGVIRFYKYDVTTAEKRIARATKILRKLERDKVKDKADRRKIRKVKTKLKGLKVDLRDARKALEEVENDVELLC